MGEDFNGSKLYWTLKSTKDADGSSRIMIYIDGAGVEEELSSSGYDIGDPIEIQGSATFTPNQYHNAMIDFQPSVGSPGFEFGAGTRMIINYILDQPH